MCQQIRLCKHIELLTALKANTNFIESIAGRATRSPSPIGTIGANHKSVLERLQRTLKHVRISVGHMQITRMVSSNAPIRQTDDTSINHCHFSDTLIKERILRMSKMLTCKATQSSQHRIENETAAQVELSVKA